MLICNACSLNNLVKVNITKIDKVRWCTRCTNILPGTYNVVKENKFSLHKWVLNSIDYLNGAELPANLIFVYYEPSTVIWKSWNALSV